jgi:UDP-galactopyranose mutase
MDGRVTNDLVCFSHLRWDFVYQRPQHLLSRAAKTMRVLFWEEPIYTGDTSPSLKLARSDEGVHIAQPHLPWGTDPDAAAAMQRSLLDDMVREWAVRDPVLWYYTPQALVFSSHLRGRPTVYDCMDELSAFADADPALPELERALMARAGLVFTGGVSLYEAKRALHRSVHVFPSGVDIAHFLPARRELTEPADQAAIGHPRAGFFGVLDERLDCALLARAAELRPDMQFVMVGPVVKIDPAELPQRPNIHYLGPKSYAELPSYIAHWDVAMMPFALNAATRFISPTKTPEYLAAGRPVVSTPIKDIVRSWGATGYVGIAADAEAFAAEADRLLSLPRNWVEAADTKLREMSWDQIWARMHALIQASRATPSRARRAIGMRAQYDHLVVGAGFAGAVLAERLAAGSGRRVLVIDRRPHIGGNAYDMLDSSGVLIHPYGPHVFHTNSQTVLDYLSRFTAWRPYEHRVLAQVNGQLLPVPINRRTINGFFGANLSENEVEVFLRSKAEPVGTVRTSADVVLGAVGRELYEAFFQSYTRKQWGRDPSELDKSVTARVPTRTDDDDRYFTDRFQNMPADGYTALFERMLDHPNIEVRTGTTYEDVRDTVSASRLVWTGPIDAFFDHRFGKLPYRSLRFEYESRATPGGRLAQPVAQVNYPNERIGYTRVTEFRHLTGETGEMSTLAYEFPVAEGEPYYPVPRPQNRELFHRYEALAAERKDVLFVGRLARYQYLNMDQVVGAALVAIDRWAEARGTWALRAAA